MSGSDLDYLELKNERKIVQVHIIEHKNPETNQTEILPKCLSRAEILEETRYLKDPTLITIEIDPKDLVAVGRATRRKL